MHNKDLKLFTMEKVEELDSLSPEKYGSQKDKFTDIQALNTQIFYDFIRQK